jgi:soluble lytic murein transglycosylase
MHHSLDWVERIPFSETRNYVQRVLENLVHSPSVWGLIARLDAPLPLSLIGEPGVMRLAPSPWLRGAT